MLNPSIKDYGAVYDVPFATVKPDSSINYKVVIEMGGKIENKAEVNESLDAVARMHNLFVYGGVPKQKIHIVAVLYAGSTPAVLIDEEYHKKFGVGNPNTKLIKELKDAGVELLVCGQSLMRQHVDPKTVNPDVKIATSRMTSVSTYQMKGYAFFIF
jgi:intracellular sulfur oxidation DsrE/DsrF family protein